METISVECLQCGQSRDLARGQHRNDETGDCLRCGYVGWAYSKDLTERTRRIFRDLPLDRRLRLRPV